MPRQHGGCGRLPCGWDSRLVFLLRGRAAAGSGFPCPRLGRYFAANEAPQIHDATDNALAQETNQQHEHQPQYQLPLRPQAEGSLKKVLQEQPDSGA